MKDLNHLVIAVIIQCLIGSASGHWVLAGMVACSVFIGREHAQAEYRWIEKYGQWRRYNLRWHNVFDRRIWDVHSIWWNLVAPMVGASIVATIAFALGA